VRRVAFGCIAAIAGLGAVALGGHDRVALAQTCVQYDATGSWQTSQGNAYHPIFTFQQSGTSLSGSATLPGDEASRAGYASNTGGVSGSLNGSRLDVTVSWQKADGGSSSGRYTATVVPSSATQGTLSGGDAGGNSWTGGGPLRCVQTSAPPPDTFGTQPNTRVFETPAPGESVVVSSPQNVPEGARTGTLEVTSSTGQLPGAAVVAEGDAERRRRVTGEAVAACWLIGPGVIKISNASLAAKIKSKTFLDKWNQLDAEGAFRICLQIVARANLEESQTPPVVTSAATCRTRPLTFTLKRRRGKVVSIKLSTKKPSKSHVRYTCTTSSGKLTIKAKRDAKGGLRKKTGKHLDVAAYRSPNTAPSDSKLAYRFKFPG
jgi:hypothetical protein